MKLIDILVERLTDIGWPGWAKYAFQTKNGDIYFSESEPESADIPGDFSVKGGDVVHSYISKNIADEPRVVHVFDYLMHPGGAKFWDVWETA